MILFFNLPVPTTRFNAVAVIRLPIQISATTQKSCTPAFS